MEGGLCSEDRDGYLKLTLEVPAEGTITRAVPHGGEEGDGRELGKENETYIYDVMVFIIRSSLGMDADASTEFEYKGYLNESSPGWTRRTYSVDGFDGVDIKFNTSESGYIFHDNDRVLVVANAGNTLDEINNLGQLRDRVKYKAWTPESQLADSHHFVMTSAYNDPSQGKITIGDGDGSWEHPYVSSIQIQRTAARIDFMYNNTNNIVGDPPYKELRYVVKDNEEINVLGTVHLQNIIPINLMQKSSYLFRRVTPSVDIRSTTLKYGAKESVNSSGIPTNYVIEPHTLDKENRRVEELDTELGTWYGNTRASQVFTSPNSYLGDKNSIATYMATKTEKSEMSYFTHYMTLAYTNENTQSKEKHDPNFMTGLLLKTVYVPSTMYSNASLAVASYTKGTTFWRYTPTKASMLEADSKYFDNLAAATAYKTAHPEDLAEIVEYPNGVCYYNLWLRHANVEADPHETFPMEYGIVRNNIYRVGVEKFTGPGTPTPTFEGPTRVHLRIFVRPWNKRVHPEILL